MSFIEQYVEFAQLGTDAPKIYHEWVARILLSTMIRRKRYFPFGHRKIYPNMWVILIGPSSSFHKSTSAELGYYLLSKKYRMEVSDFSYEGLIEALDEKSQGIFYFDEFGRFTKLLERDYNAPVKGFLTESYNCPPEFDRKKSGKSLTVSEPFVNLLHTSTQAWLLSKQKEADLVSGWFARYLLVPAWEKEKDEALFEEPDIELRDKVYHALLKYQEIVSGKMTLSDEAEEVYRTFYKEHAGDPNNSDPLIDPFFARIREAFFKLAIIHQVNNAKGKQQIEGKAAQQAQKDCLFLTNQIVRLWKEELALNGFHAEKLKVWKYIKRKGSVTKSAILNHTHFSARKIEEIVKTLEESEKIKIIPSKGERGRTKYTYKLI